VIGGGVIGCFTAYFLNKFGWRVRLFEADRVGKACSHGNCGFICPSHVLPLPMPGAAWSVAKQMMRRDSPIYVAPRLDPALWDWLTRFALRCRKDLAMESAHARHALLASSMELYRHLLAEEDFDVEWQDRGLLMVYKSPHHFQAYEKTAQFVHEEFGITATPISGDHLTDLEPTLQSGLAGGWHFTGDAHLRPDRLLGALSERLKTSGVEIHEGTAVTGFEIRDGRADAVVTSRGTFAADAVVVSAGAETPLLGRQLGGRIPIQPGKGYSITMAAPARRPVTPMIFEEYHVAVTPWRTGLRIGSTMEFVGYDRSINRRRLELFQRAAAEYLTVPPDGAVEEEWFGWRPMTYDDRPCIGPAPRAANVVVAAGHGMIGMATGPASGKLAAELVAGLPPHVDPAPFALTRFGR
jgi:D-amino-acid dehydrogenase